MARPKKKKEVPAPYKFTVKLLGKFFNSTGSTFEEALANLGIKNGRGVSVWTVEHEGKTTVKIVNPSTTSRLFSLGGLSREIALKQFRTIFGL